MLIKDNKKKKAHQIAPTNQELDFIQMFNQQANSFPNQVIIVEDGKEVSYHELHTKSDQVAAYLRDLGVKPSELIGLFSSLSIDFIIFMLGILKSGAAYFPLDPSYPKDRLQYMLKDAKPKIVFSEPHYYSLLENEEVIEIDNSIYFNKRPIIKTTPQPDDLAYVIYTSGSTGYPKGIAVTHRSLPNIALAHNYYYPENMRMLISGGVCFDATLLAIFHGLINNCPLYLHKQKNKSAEKLRFIKNNEINYIISIPSQYLKLLRNGQLLPSLKCVSLTGENLPTSICKLHAKYAPNAFLYNEYGPSECAIGSTIAKIYDPNKKSLQQVSVGRPLPNTAVYILNKNLEVVPKGGIGEICIAGIGLAKGYINNNELTEEKFVTIQLNGKKPIRLYRTGDIGRFTIKNNLEFLGRFEQNVLISDQLINLGELEYIISQYPTVLESAVVIHEYYNKKDEVILYITSGNPSFDKSKLLLFLKRKLPHYSVSFSIVCIKKFPTSPNGKIDREALVKYCT